MTTDLVELVTGDRRPASSAEESRRAGIQPLLDRHADAYRYYGSGKVALRDGLRAMLRAEGILIDESGLTDAEPGTADRRLDYDVLLPAYVPDAVAEPIRELGLDPRYYAVTPDLRPDVSDLRRRIDEDTIAVASVNYFGFPQPGESVVAGISDEYDCYHVDDNAHSTLSLTDGQLLGTRGDVGITSLWKTLPVPNGAVLYVSDGSLQKQFEPSPLTGVAERVTAADVRYLCAVRARTVLDGRDGLRRPVDALVDRILGTTVPSPRRRYEASKRRCSALTMRVCARTDPADLRRRRRQNYRAWLDALETVPHAEPLYSELPDGICPQTMPVETARPRRLQSRLAANGLDDVHTWPRLATAVATDPTYATAQYLAEHVLALPVGPRVDPERIVTVGAGLGQE